MRFAVRCRAVVVSLLAIFLAACPPRTYGAYSPLVSLPAMPDIGCVEATLDETPGVTVLHFTAKNSRTLSLRHGAVKRPTNHWVYEVDGFVGNVHLEEEGNGVSFSHSLRRPWTKLTESEKAHVEALVALINASLEAKCGVPVSKEQS
jgi:hypothetical protein